MRDNATTLIVIGIVGYFLYQWLQQQGKSQTTSNVKCVDDNGNVVGVPDASGNCAVGTPWLP